MRLHHPDSWLNLLYTIRKVLFFRYASERVLHLSNDPADSLELAALDHLGCDIAAATLTSLFLLHFQGAHHRLEMLNQAFLPALSNCLILLLLAWRLLSLLGSKLRGRTWQSKRHILRLRHVLDCETTAAEDLLL